MSAYVRIYVFPLESRHKEPLGEGVFEGELEFVPGAGDYVELRGNEKHSRRFEIQRREVEIARVWDENGHRSDRVIYNLFGVERPVITSCLWRGSL